MIHLGILGVGSETDGCKGYITDHSLTLCQYFQVKKLWKCRSFFLMLMLIMLVLLFWFPVSALLHLFTDSSVSVLPTFWFFPYFMEPRVIAALPSLSMLDYQVMAVVSYLILTVCKSWYPFSVKIWTKN